MSAAIVSISKCLVVVQKALAILRHAVLAMIQIFLKRPLSNILLDNVYVLAYAR